MRRVNVLDQIEYGDALIARCNGVMEFYDQWNANVREFHKDNSHLYLREIKIREPPPVERKYGSQMLRSDRPYVPRMDPLSVALQETDYQLHYGSQMLPTEESLRFQNTHTMAYYRRQRQTQKPDPSIQANQVRCHGPDDASARVTEIPNSSSKSGMGDVAKQTRVRNMRIRNEAFRTAQTARPDETIAVPKPVQRLAKSSRSSRDDSSLTKAEIEHRITRQKIEKMEVHIQEILRASAHRIRQLNETNCRRRRAEEERLDVDGILT
jgi:hypothetical protein